MKTAIRKKINSRLAKLPTFHDSIPIGSIITTVESFGFSSVCEDGSPFSAIFCGHNGRASIEIVDSISREKQNEAIQLQWWGEREHGCKGKIEINCYVM